MSEYTSRDGTKFTDDDLERWAKVAESKEGYTGGHLGPAVVGRPISVGAQARPFTLRLDEARRVKLDEIAQERHTTPSQVMRELIDTL